MALDDSLYCTMRDVIRDAPILPATRDRMLAALEAYHCLETMVEAVIENPTSDILQGDWLKVPIDGLKKI